MQQFYQVEDYQFQRSIGYLLRNASKLISAQIESLFAEKDVSFAQWLVLANLGHKRAKTAAEICQVICYDSGAITRLLDQLEQRGLIARERSTQDRRTIELTLTDAGRKITEDFLPLLLNLYNDLLGDFTHDEAQTLVQLLSKLNDKLSEAPKAMAA